MTRRCLTEDWLNEEEIREYQPLTGIGFRSSPRTRSVASGLGAVDNKRGYPTPAETSCFPNFRLGFGPSPPALLRQPPQFRCEECKETFRAKDDLEVHKLTAHHKEEICTPPPYGTFLYTKADAPMDMHLVENRIGKFRGIQGENNSCYLDSSLMAMFYANDTFDGLLSTPGNLFVSPTPVNNNVEYARLFLCMNIVNNLRRRGFVPSALVLEWRRMINHWFGAGVDFDSHCAEEEACEFVDFMLKAFGQGVIGVKFVLKNIKQVNRLIKSGRKKDSSEPEGQSMMQLLPPSQEAGGGRSFVWSIEMLVDYTLRSEDLRFTELNSSLILQLPRYGKRDRVIGAVVPNPFLYLLSYQGAEVTKARFALRALVVIGISHFVTYLRVPSQHEYSWLYYDSMSDRVTEQNIPVIQDVTDELSILENANAAALIAQKGILEGHLQRVVQDMSMAFYSRVDYNGGVPTNQGLDFDRMSL